MQINTLLTLSQWNLFSSSSIFFLTAFTQNFHHIALQFHQWNQGIFVDIEALSPGSGRILPPSPSKLKAERGEMTKTELGLHLNTWPVYCQYFHACVITISDVFAVIQYTGQHLLLSYSQFYISFMKPVPHSGLMKENNIFNQVSACYVIALFLIEEGELFA